MKKMPQEGFFSAAIALGIALLLYIFGFSILYFPEGFTDFATIAESAIRLDQIIDIPTAANTFVCIPGVLRAVPGHEAHTPFLIASEGFLFVRGEVKMRAWAERHRDSSKDRNFFFRTESTTPHFFEQGEFYHRFLGNLD